MAVLELYGKCKELGYCDCGGFLGCSDPNPPAPKPVIENELEAVRRVAHREPSAYKNHNLKYELALVDCEVCDRSHAPDHPHIANIDGDEPIDDGPDGLPEPGPAPEVPRELPDWLRDKPGSQVIQPMTSTGPAVPTCKLCGKPWAPKHECAGAAEPSMGAFQRKVLGSAKNYATKRKAPACEVCGVIKRSNHNCKGKPGGEAAVPASEAAVPQADERIATELPPQPASVVLPEPAAEDQELAAMGAILAALEGLNADQIGRMLAYVADRKGISRETGLIPD